MKFVRIITPIVSNTLNTITFKRGDDEITLRRIHNKKVIWKFVYDGTGDVLVNRDWAMAYKLDF